MATERAQARASAEPEPLRTEHALTAFVSCDGAVDLGRSAAGHRRVIPIVGGRVEGPRLRGEVLAGGADWQLTRPDGVLEIDARYEVRLDDGTCVSVRNRGIVCPPQDGAPGAPYARTVPRFEVPPDGPHAWLARSVFVGTLAVVRGPAPVNVRVDVFRVL